MKKLILAVALVIIVAMVLSLNHYLIINQAVALNFSWLDILYGIILGFLCWICEELSVQSDLYKKPEKIWIDGDAVEKNKQNYGMSPPTVILSFFGVCLVFGTPIIKNWDYFLAMLADNSVDFMSDFSPFIFAVIGLTAGLITGLFLNDYTGRDKQYRLLHVLVVNIIISVWIFVWGAILYKQPIFLEIILFTVNYFLFLISGMIAIKLSKKEPAKNVLAF